MHSSGQLATKIAYHGVRLVKDADRAAHSRQFRKERREKGKEKEDITHLFSVSTDRTCVLIGLGYLYPSKHSTEYSGRVVKE